MTLWIVGMPSIIDDVTIISASDQSIVPYYNLYSQQCAEYKKCENKEN